MQAFLKSGKLGPSTSTDKKNAKAGSSNAPQKKTRTPWVEKYRPKTVDDVVEQGDVVAVLRQCLSGADLPNLLFYGPPGTGKTSTILAAAKQLFGDIYRDRILELNASDERGIQVIRDKVKSFSQFRASGIRPDGKPCPPFKIVILDEADSMTYAAQAALRRTMEKETKSTRFCLICNYVSRIIPPLTSRCSKFRFKPIVEKKVLERLELISREENVNCDPSVLKCLVEASGGDMRRAITCLQSCARLKGASEKIEREDVLEVTGVIPEEWIAELLDVCRTSNYEKLSGYVDRFTLEAYSTSQLLEQVHEVVVLREDITDGQKTVICEKLAECSFRILDGASEYIQLMDLGCTMLKAMQM